MNASPTGAIEPLARPRLYEQVAQRIMDWVAATGMEPGDKLPPERELAVRLGVSRATLAQALVALEVVGMVTVRHGGGTVLNEPGGTGRIVEALRAHADQSRDIIEARDALETKLAALAAVRHTPEDLRRIDDALTVMSADIDNGGRGVEGDELFHAAVTQAAHSRLLAELMAEMSDLIRTTRIESLSQPGRPRESLHGHQQIAEAIRRRDQQGAAEAMHGHVELVSDVALLRD